MITDNDLLKAAQDLDQDALNAIFDRYAPLIYRYAIRLCGDAAEADDIVGDVFALLLKHLSEGRGPRDNLRFYLYQMAYHKVIDHARLKKHETSISPMLSSDEVSLQTRHENAEQLEILENVLKLDLSEDQKQVVILRFIEGLNLKETADVLGKDIGNIKVIQSRAISRIRDMMVQRSGKSL